MSECCAKTLLVIEQGINMQQATTGSGYCSSQHAFSCLPIINSKDLHDFRLCGHDFSYLVLVVVRPDIIETGGGEQRRRMSEEFTAAAYREKHL